VVLGSLLGVLTLPVLGPCKGIKHIFEEIYGEARKEQLDEERIISKLTELQLQLELHGSTKRSTRPGAGPHGPSLRREGVQTPARGSGLSG
jgi:hypothetical protein